MVKYKNSSTAAYYNYTADGERNIKLTAPRLDIQQNAEMLANPMLVYPTLYASPLVTLTQHGYTKHYFEEGRRICRKIGGGMQGNVAEQEIDDRVEGYALGYEDQFYRQHDGILQTFNECIGVEPQIVEEADLRRMLVEQELQRDESEPAFYYHGDHLGSAAYLTSQGQVTQTLNYLPYGEDWVEQNFFQPHDTTRLGIYRFNGKEKDYESGFHYYGARYYWSEVLTGWLSVDPMMDKYPSMSPYNYCAWNPVKFEDPNGDSVRIIVGASPVGECKIYLFSASERKANPSLSNSVAIVPVYPVTVENESGESRTFYYTRIGYRGNDQTEVTFDVQHDMDSFRGVIRDRWNKKNNVLELRTFANRQTVKGRKGRSAQDRTAIQFHVLGATDGCLLAVGKDNFVSIYEGSYIDPNLPNSSSGAQNEFMQTIMDYRRQDVNNGYGDEINVAFRQLYINLNPRCEVQQWHSNE